MTEKMKNILIGLFVISAITIVVSMVLFLEPTIGDGRKTLKVRFANIAGIVQGTRVTFAGKPVGEVVAIHEVKNARETSTDESGKVYLYELTLKMDSGVEVFSTDDIAIRTTGLMGERSIGIIPKVALPGKISKPITNEVLFANSVDALENTFTQVSKSAHEMEKAVAHLDAWFMHNNNTLTHTLGGLDGTLNQLSALFPSLKETTLLVNENLTAVRESLQNDQLLQKLSSLTANLDRAADAFNTEGLYALRNLGEITNDLAKGTGTIGRLITGDDFYLRLNSLLSKGETLMNDVNHYGLLFQYDKQWQRSRTKRANLLKSLDSPKEFRAFFDGEVDAISTSLGRLTELLERAGGEKDKMANHEGFKKQFAGLLRRVEGLSDSIKLYNQELVTQAEAD